MIENEEKCFISGYFLLSFFVWLVYFVVNYFVPELLQLILANDFINALRSVPAWVQSNNPPILVCTRHSAHQEYCFD